MIMIKLVPFEVSITPDGKCGLDCPTADKSKESSWCACPLSVQGYVVLGESYADCQEYETKE